MTLQEADFEEILARLKPWITLWLAEKAPERPPTLYDMELRDRILRVEEELKHQRELMQQGFDQIDRRITLMEKQFTQKFEQVDKRFEQVDKRFEQVDKRFEILTQRLDRFMFWSFGITMTAAGLVITVLKLWH